MLYILTTVAELNGEPCYNAVPSNIVLSRQGFIEHESRHELEDAQPFHFYQIGIVVL